MDQQMLRCNICGGNLKMQANKEAVCESCGMAYSIASLRDRFNGLKVSITGSNEDIDRWKELVNRYLEKNDYTAAERIIKKILEAAPADLFTNTLYEQMQDWKYLKVVNGVLVSYTGKKDQLVLPKGILEIGDEAFAASSIVSIELSEGVRKIGKSAFKKCTFLKNIRLTGSLVEIDEEAFAFCNFLSICIPHSVRKMGDHCFTGSALQEIDASNVDFIGIGALSYCQNLEKVVLPKKIKKIPVRLFEGSGIVKMDIPSHITEVGAGAFRGCKSLRKVVFNDALSIIDDNAFCGCEMLETIELPNSLKRIGDYAFGYCDSLKSVYLPSSVDVGGISMSAFCSCQRISSIEWKNIDKYYDLINHDLVMGTAAVDYDIMKSYDIHAGAFANTPFWSDYCNRLRNTKRQRWFRLRKCQHCGGEFKGLFTKVCSKCGKTKDY